MAKSKSVVAVAEVDETFPTDCKIYDLQKFLGIFSVFNDPDIEWNETSASITSGKSGLRYGYGESVTPEPPETMKEFVGDATFARPANIPPTNPLCKYAPSFSTTVPRMPTFPSSPEI